METTFSYSLRRHLDYVFKEISRALIVEDGVSFARVEKPFVSIHYLGENDEILSAGRRSYNEIYHYQIGLYAISCHKLGTLSSKLKEILRDPKGIPIYDIDTGFITADRFVIDVGEFTPMRADDTAEETTKHRGYFVVDIDIMRNADELTFTQ